jgi:hypothetical protein
MIWLIIIIVIAIVLADDKIQKPNTTPTSNNVVNDKVIEMVELNADMSKDEILDIVNSGRNTPLSTNDIQYICPPGYTGPNGGPFVWAGVGPAPNGKEVVIGTPVHP